MTIDRRKLIGALSGLGLAPPLSALAQTQSGPAETTTTVTVLGDLHPPTMARIALSPDGRRIAYVIGRATVQQLLVIGLDDMSQKVYPLGTVFLTEMMWGSNSQVLVRLRYFRQSKKNATTKDFTETRYIWVALDIETPRRPLPILAVLTEMSRCETAAGFGLVYENRVSSIPYIPDVPNELAGQSLGQQLLIMQQLMQMHAAAANPEMQEPGQFDGPIDDVDTSSARPYDEFYRMDLATQDQKRIISLDVLATDYAIAADGHVVGFSTYIRDGGKGVVSFLAAPDEGRPKPVKVLERPAATTRDLKVEGLGRGEHSMLVSTDNRARYFELSADGTQTALDFTGKPIFDGWTHLHVGFLPDGDDDVEPVYFAPEWMRIWSAVKSMAPADTVVHIESHAKDARKLIMSVKDTKSGQMLYHFVDLSIGRTEFITRGSLPLHPE